ncbi:MAG: co-chaperone GroES [Acidimicrobiales bacterium]|nr:co-chaperone GroES [Acidimicrobiales bacterium]MDP6161859.1 co-chaperone GroES [Acidimicrobiales bacterium]MDP6284773.1 co-chaperone GroES [Acidimicrobiales bacterium]HJL91140.1 co-chaperone GroES [Acidimicrobiales bacterium]HJO41111.1 co-chaperone GroES [Acidimicrobiales bacterium]
MNDSKVIKMPGPAEDDGLPIKMLNDRILVQIDDEDGERRSTGGILIPATAQMGKRLAWAEIVAVGPNVRSMEVADRVLFNPEDRYEVEVRGLDYIILRERDIHAVASKRLEEGSTGLYL